MSTTEDTNATDRGSELSEGLGAGAETRHSWETSGPRFERTYCSQCGGEFGPGEAGFSSCGSHMANKAKEKIMIEAYQAKYAPHADMVRDVKFEGASFEVGIDCQQPDEPGEVTHPNNYWVECVKLGGKWWSSQDVLSDAMQKCLDEALQRKIAEEHRELRVSV